MTKNNPNFKPVEYFDNPKNSYHRQFIAMRAYYVENMTASDVASKFGYTVSTIYSLARDFKDRLESNEQEDPFFKSVIFGRKHLDLSGDLIEIIIAHRKNYMSVPEIKSALEAIDINVSSGYIFETLKREGFARLPRRDKETKKNIELEIPKELIAEKTRALSYDCEKFTSQLAGVLCFLPVIKYTGIDKIILKSSYPETKCISRLSAILSFIALKLSNIKRYSADDLWCMDRGMGLFAGLNVLPKTAWFSSYSSGTSREMNISFLKSLCTIWRENGLLSDTANVDFTSIPYWGDDDHLENNWSGKRGKALGSIMAVLVQDPDTGIICYGDTTVKHDTQNETILEFLDFYKTSNSNSNALKYLIFDSKVTSYKNLCNLNKQGIKFITIRRRGAKLVERIKKIKKNEWKTIKIQRDNGKSRSVRVFEEFSNIKDYEGEIRQIYLTGNGKIKPAIIITNDFEISLKDIIRKYSRRWLVEKEISEHIEFFHLNRNSSGIVVKVDFDLTMSILAHNIYRLFAKDLAGYSHCDAGTLFDKFIHNSGDIEIKDDKIQVNLKRKRHLPLLLENMDKYNMQKYEWLNELKLSFFASTTT
jgi:transposase